MALFYICSNSIFYIYLNSIFKFDATSVFDAYLSDLYSFNAYIKAKHVARGTCVAELETHSLV